MEAEQSGMEIEQDGMEIEQNSAGVWCVYKQNDGRCIIVQFAGLASSRETAEGSEVGAEAVATQELGCFSTRAQARAFRRQKIAEKVCDP